MILEPLTILSYGIAKNIHGSFLTSFFLGKTLRPGVKHLLEADLAWLLRLESQRVAGVTSVELGDPIKPWICQIWPFAF